MGIGKLSLKKKMAIYISLLLLWVFFSIIQFSNVHDQDRLTTESHEGRNYEEIISPAKQRILSIYVRELSKLITEWFTLTKEQTKDPLINKHEYMFRFNSYLCTSPRTDILVVIHSDPQNFKNRLIIRKTWCSLKRLQDMSIVCVFMLGERYNETLLRKIKDESDSFGDIVQGNFFDSYKNLTYKHVMALYWITSQCNDVDTIVKIDDDVFVNIYKLVNFSINTGHIHNNLYCSVYKFGRPRRMSSKWLTSRGEYPFDFFPNYCAGLAYIMSADEAMKLSKASESMSFYWIDDVYVTGILALKSGLGTKQLDKTYDAAQAVFLQNESHVSISNVLFYHGFSDWTHLWNSILAEFGNS